jgi:hypothetical protein
MLAALQQLSKVQDGCQGSPSASEGRIVACSAAWKNRLGFQGGAVGANDIAVSGD